MYRDTSSVDCAPRELTHACYVYSPLLDQSDFPRVINVNRC